MAARLSEVEYLDHCDSYDGLCLGCGDWTTGGVEPDAEGYLCEACDERKVIGAELALIRGLLDFEEG
jgi:hypothetical protein